MADYPAMPLWTDSYLADTRHLSRAEHGSYLLLLMEAWRRPKCDLPDDDTLLARLSGCTQSEWEETKPIVMALWTLDGRTKTWHQKRQQKEREFVRRKSKSQSDKATKRWNSSEKKHAGAKPKRCPANAPTPNKIKNKNMDCFRDIRGTVRMESGSDEAAAWLGWLRANNRQCPNPLNGFFYFKTKLPPSTSEAA